jgi:nucleoside-diphosphate-sugar epimerase
VIVVTGGSGFVGGAIARALLARGDRVRSVQRGDAPALRALGAEVVRADLSDRSAALSSLAGAAAVLHVAAKVEVWGPRREFVRANVDATANVLEACRVHGTGRLVFTSTPSVVHDGRDVEGADESAPIPARFTSAYPETKARAEQLVLAANGPALATVALRPHLVWGPGDPQLTARILAMARAGRLRLVGGGASRVDAAYIDNVVDAHLAALDRLAPGAACAGRAYFVAQGEPVPQREIVNGILAAAGLPPCERSISPALASVTGALCEVAWTLLRRTDAPPMTRFTANQLATAHWFDLSAARRDLGYAPRVSTGEGLRRLAESLRSAPAAA